jgi:hypothetical protein
VVETRLENSDSDLDKELLSSVLDIHTLLL